MSVLKTRLEWFEDASIDTPVVIDSATEKDLISADMRRTLEAKNNELTFRLRNPQDKVLSITPIPGFPNIGHKWVDTNNQLRFVEGQVIKFYAGYFDDVGEIDTTTGSPHLLFVGEIAEVGSEVDEKKTVLKIKTVDRSFVILNKILTAAFTADGGVESTIKNLPAPKIIINIVQNSTDENKDKNFNKGDPEFDVTAKLDTDGGFVESKRPDNSEFPVTSINKVFRPAYEIISDLSQTEATNTGAEIDALTAPANRAYIFFVDESNNFHWFYPSDNVDLTLNEGTDEKFKDGKGEVKNHKLTRKILDAANLIFYHAGQDLNGVGNKFYKFDEQTELGTLKVKYFAWLDISTALKDAELDNGGITAINADESTVFTGTYPYTTSWNESVSSNGTYNTAFRQEARKRADQRAASFFAKKSNPRWTGRIEVKGARYNAGDLIQFTSPSLGLLQQKLRILDVRHRIGPDGWFTGLTVEQDEKVLGG